VTHQTCIFKITVFGIETGGSNATIDILTGNNPHLGPYDGGFKYINQFKSLIPNFSAVTITCNSSNLYINNESGTFNKSVENSILIVLFYKC
jgi:hypothetical protein